MADAEQGNGENSDPFAENGGHGGTLFGRPRNRRGDARRVAQMISLGVISQEHAESLLAGGFGLAAQMLKEGKAREYAACMKIAVSAVQLEMRQAELDKDAPQTPAQVNVQVNVNGIRQELLNDPDYLQYARRRSIEGNGDASPVCDAG
jgi:hypothetical protein